jgi:hypothetical protein
MSLYDSMLHDYSPAELMEQGLHDEHAAADTPPPLVRSDSGDLDALGCGAPQRFNRPNCEIKEMFPLFEV